MSSFLFCLGVLVGCGGSDDQTPQEEEQPMRIHRGTTDEPVNVPPPPTAYEPYRGGSSGEHTLTPPNKPIACPPACGGGANKPQ